MWSEQLIQTLKNDAAAVVVSVVAVDGSVPREIGATMVVSQSSCTGTIGGGNLEHKALAQANDMLVGADHNGQAPFCEVQNQIFSLGPSLGQCCGGKVELLYQRVPRDADWLSELMSCSSGVWLCRCLDDPSVQLIDSNQQKNTLQLPVSGKTGVVSDNRQRRWICHLLNESLPSVWLFGAGHVGQAVAQQLSLLPCNVTWLDPRQEWLDKQTGLDIESVVTDAPADEIPSAPDYTHYIVMTHSHTLDFDICHAVLQRGQFAWLGLIGSATKRQTFANRLAHRGISDDLINQLRCPVGGLSLQSSEPFSIALSIATELAQVWEQEVV